MEEEKEGREGRRYFWEGESERLNRREKGEKEWREGGKEEGRVCRRKGGSRRSRSSGARGFLY